MTTIYDRGTIIEAIQDLHTAVSDYQGGRISAEQLWWRIACPTIRLPPEDIEEIAELILARYERLPNAARTLQRPAVQPTPPKAAQSLPEPDGLFASLGDVL